MAVIKAGQPVATAVFSLRDVEREAAEILSQAREQAAAIVDAARRQGQEIRQRCHAEGLAAGKAEGLAAGREDGAKAGREQALEEQRAQLSHLIHALTTAAAAVEADRRRIAAQATADVVRLAVAIARRVTRRLGEVDAAVTEANVNEALKLVMHASDVRIAVHPRQIELLREILPKLKLAWPTLEHVSLMEDSTLAPGGCRVVTSSGQIDGDLDRQIDNVVADLLPADMERPAQPALQPEGGDTRSA